MTLTVTSNKFADRVRDLRAQGFRVDATHKRAYAETVKLRKRRVWDESNFRTITALVPKRNPTLYNAREAAERGYTRLLERGGATYVRLTAPDGRVYEGEAICNPIDRFTKKEGLNKALGRAIKNLTHGLDVEKIKELEKQRKFQKEMTSIKAASMAVKQ